MIDISWARQNKDSFTTAITKKDPNFPVDQLLKIDESARSLRTVVEELRQQKNEYAQQAKAGVTDELRMQSIEIGKQLKQQEKELVAIETQLQDLLFSCPNIPQDDVPVGNKEENVVVKTYGEKPVYDFEVKHHVELGQLHDWFDFEAAAKIAASNFVLYKKDAVKMMYALAMFMLKHNSKQGYEPVLPPYFANEKTLTVSGNFPKFKDEVFSITQDNLYAIPTSEVCLANIYREEILSGKDIPIRMTAWSSCFRREAGNYGAMERGLIRIHQFEKVELFTLCKPEDSDKELEKMVACAESLLQQLGLHYQVSLLAAQDCSFQSAKTFDIEVWLPGQKRYYEVSSASNCSDFQARRGKIRYRDKEGEKPQLVHTLNASSLALPRLMVALIETYQKADGSIELPEVLKREMF